MASRLDELRRQRELVREHLRWLDAEIDAAADARPEAPSANTVSAVRIPAATTPVPVALPATQVASPDQPVPDIDVVDIRSEVRSGCLLYCSIAFLILGSVVAYIFLRY